MVVVYLAVALYNLGSARVPVSPWQPQQKGETAVIDLGRQVDVASIYCYWGVNGKRFDVPSVSLEYEQGGRFQPLAILERGDCSTWKATKVGVTTSKLRLRAANVGGVLNELAVVARGSCVPVGGVKVVGSRSQGPRCSTSLLDEQHTFVASPSHLHGFYFDEIYHGRTAYEHLHRMEPYETTHPPLGKLFIAAGIATLGMHPFGWRIVGTLFGTALLPVIYLFARKLFVGRFFAFAATFLLMVDFLHFTQSRIALIDIFAVFFITLMYYFIHDLFMYGGVAAGWRKAVMPLFMAGVCFGLGAACKWIALYGGAGLVLLMGLHLVNQYRQCQSPAEVQRYVWTYLLPVGCLSVCALVIIPALIYLCSYLPFLMVQGEQHGLVDVLRNQRDMFRYHSTLKATHPFSSPWWSWPLDLQPVWYYSGTGLPPGQVSTIAALGNPLIWWLGIPAVIAAAIAACRRGDRQMAVVLTGFACQYLPWVLVSRLTFIYHFFSAVPFMILSQVYVLQRLMARWPSVRYGAWAYLAASGLLFVVFYPVLSGLQVSAAYVDRLKWLSSWIF